ncbi:MAG: MopE-related protein, partial [Bacteroidota bacterium]
MVPESNEQDQLIVVIDESDVDAPPGDTLFEYYSLNMITGYRVGQHWIVPGAFITPNYDVRYEVGDLTILPDTLVVSARDTQAACDSLPDFVADITGYHYSDADSNLVDQPLSFSLLTPSGNGVPAGYPSDGTYRIVPGGMTLIAPADYLLVFEEGQLLVPDHFTYYADADGDGFGINSDTIIVCDSIAPVGYAVVAGDCNDSNASINPTASESCNNGIDDDCDGQTDENCLPTCTLGAITGPPAICNPNGQTIVYSVPAAAGASSYTWSVPPGTNLISGQGSHTITVSWPYSVIHSGLKGSICVVANFGGTCVSASSCMAISVQASAPVTPPYISGPPRACAGEEATYSIAGVARADSYVWTPPTGVTLLSGQGSNVITVRFESGFTGGFLAVSGVNQCGVSPQRTKTLGLNVLSAPTFITGFRNGVCGMSGVSYSIPAVNGATSYLWTVPAGVSLVGPADGTSIVVNFNGNYSSGSISVKAMNLCG